MLKESLEKLLIPQDLSFVESHDAIAEILLNADPHQAAAFLALMRAKGESIEELKGIVSAMRSCMNSIITPYPVLDIVGTGGDGAHTINISTAAAILAAACGVKVAKHGNRSVSSQCGSADVLEALGVNIHQSSDVVLQSIEKAGMCFLFAPDYHPAMKKIKEVRNGLKIRTFFNLIGPLLNPATPEYLMIGVADRAQMQKMAQIIQGQKIKRAFVFHGASLDELTTIGPSEIFDVTPKVIKKDVLDPSVFGFSLCSLDDLRGGDAKKNARHLLDIFEGKPGPKSDTVIFNAAVAVYLYGLAPTIAEGIQMVKAAIESRKAIHVLEQLRST